MQDIASLAFSADGRLLAVQGGAPEWSLTVWAWERAKIVGTMRTADSSGNPVHQVRLVFPSPKVSLIGKVMLIGITKPQLVSQVISATSYCSQLSNMSIDPVS